MRKPSTDDLPEELARAARGAAGRLAEAGHCAWIVGGAVRDLALGRTPSDVDLATAATPDEIEATFRRTAAVGRAFGTVLVMDFGVEVQVTTFRAERGYADGRHPDRVRFARTPEEDARRRDFTCNAIFLDPLTGDVRDPTGGLADLAAGRLRCVGDPAERFAEDGLRILRLARFTARYGLEVEPATLAAAAASLDALRGLSAERVFGELADVVVGPDPRRALALLDDVGALARVLPGFGPGRRALLERLPAGAGPHAWWAALAGKDAETLQRLRAPRALSDAVLRAWGIARTLAEAPPEGRSERIRLVRDPAWPDALALARAEGGSVAALAQELEALRAALAPEGLFPRPWIESADLAAAGVPRGPRWGELLREAERLQLEGLLADRPAALAWLARAKQLSSGERPCEEGS